MQIRIENSPTDSPCCQWLHRLLQQLGSRLWQCHRGRVWWSGSPAGARPRPAPRAPGRLHRTGTDRDFRQTLKFEDRWQVYQAYPSLMRPRRPSLTPTSRRLLLPQSARPPCRVPHWEPWKGHCRPRQIRASTCRSGWRHRAAARHLSRKWRMGWGGTEGQIFTALAPTYTTSWHW